MDLKKIQLLYIKQVQTSRIAIDYDVITTDYNYKNHIKSKRNIQILQPIKFQFLPISINNNKENLIYYSPVIAGNASTNNGWTSTL